MYRGKISKAFPSALIVLVALVLAACGSGGGSASTGGQGTVAVLLTDSATEEFSEVNVTVTKIELLSEGGHVTVSTDEFTANLLDLKDETQLVALTSVPSGWYDKVRLWVTGVELVGKDGNPVLDPPVKLAGGGKLDLNPQGPFFVESGGLLTVRLDMDMEKSIKIDGNKNFYMFRPVVFIEVVKGAPLGGRLVRMEGAVSGIDPGAMTFRLCPASLKGPGSGAPCVVVEATADTSVFDSSADGAPVAFGDIAEGDAVTVIGKFVSVASAQDFEGGSTLVLRAIVVEIGEFLNLEGAVQSAPDAGDLFGFLPDPGQEVASETLSARLQRSGGGGLATKIYSGSGQALDETAIVPGARVEIDGKLVLSDTAPDVLNAAFVLVAPAAPSLETLTGEITAIQPGMRRFTLMTATDSVCVDVPLASPVLRVVEVPDPDDPPDGTKLVSEPIGFGGLVVGDMVDVHGQMGAACFVAEAVVVFE
ncbi:MAG: hypothetical protein Kow0025_09980 [Thermodesulfovibrionales bacterium]